MAKKKKAKKVPPTPEDDEVPVGNTDEDGDDVIDLYEESDDLTEDIDYDLTKVEDDMLADETEEEEDGLEVDEVVSMLRMIKCGPCPGSKHVDECQVRHDHGCPPDKAEKFVPLTDEQRKKKAKRYIPDEGEEEEEEE